MPPCCQDWTNLSFWGKCVHNLQQSCRSCTHEGVYRNARPRSTVSNRRAARGLLLGSAGHRGWLQLLIAIQPLARWPLRAGEATHLSPRPVPGFHPRGPTRSLAAGRPRRRPSPTTVPWRSTVYWRGAGGEASRQVKPQSGPTCQLACSVVRAYGHDTFGFQSSHMPEGLFLNNHRWST